MLQPMPRLLTRDHLYPLMILPGRDGKSPMDRYYERHTRGGWCWEWIGGLNRDGYGQLRVGAWGMLQAHQFAYLVHVGDIPAGLVVRHSCDRPSCVNPDHLILGTQRDNAQDAIERGRLAGRNARPVLNPELVRSIRKRNAEGEAKDAIARDLGINRATVRCAINGRNWKHVTEETTAA